MSNARFTVLCICMTCLGSVGVPEAQAASPQPMVRKVNQVRVWHGLPKLRYSPRLARSANGWGSHLISTDRFRHTGIRASARFRHVGEILAYHRGWRLKRSGTVRRWLASPGHRAAILSPTFRYVGAGRSRGYLGRRRATMWVVQFAAHR